MVSRGEFELEKAGLFVMELFWQLDSWVSSLQDINSVGRAVDTEMSEDRQELVRVLRHGFMMRLSKLGPMVGKSCRKRFVKPEFSEADEQVEWEQIHLNGVLDELVCYHEPFFNKMGTSFRISAFPEVVISVEGARSGPLFTYVVWWILGTWPDRHIVVDFVADEEKVRVVFEDRNHVHTLREGNRHKVLKVWECIIEYLIMVEYHGWCIWPRPGGLKKLEIILPLRPPTDEELDAPMPAWMQ